MLVRIQVLVQLQYHRCGRTTLLATVRLSGWLLSGRSLASHGSAPTTVQASWHKVSVPTFRAYLCFETSLRARNENCRPRKNILATVTRRLNEPLSQRFDSPCRHRRVERFQSPWREPSQERLQYRWITVCVTTELACVCDPATVSRADLVCF